MAVALVGAKGWGEPHLIARPALATAVHTVEARVKAAMGPCRVELIGEPGAGRQRGCCVRKEPRCLGSQPTQPPAQSTPSTPLPIPGLQLPLPRPARTTRTWDRTQASGDPLPHSSPIGPNAGVKPCLATGLDVEVLEDVELPSETDLQGGK